MVYFKDGKPSPEWLQKMEAVRDILTSGGRTLTQGALAWLWARSEQTLPNSKHKWRKTAAQCSLVR